MLSHQNDRFFPTSGKRCWSQESSLSNQNDWCGSLMLNVHPQELAALDVIHKSVWVKVSSIFVSLLAC